MVAIVDYGVGNLFSLKCSLAAIGADVTVTADPEVLASADQILLPGVGAFGDAAAKLRIGGLDQVLIKLAKEGKPLLGICLGMQLLFEKSFEYGEHQGLGLIKGSVVGMEGKLPADLKIPHIGWNALQIQKESPLLKNVKEGDCVYFVHSFYAEDCDEAVIATAEYGREMTAAVGYKNVFGCQFHPEKSGKVGLSILRAFLDIKEGEAW
ncbi:MAG: imidazole glycerol phosphate synthase subunit HisH [Oscillospiraceae bacterium]|nr:imidazole glycerol phosphate synthase subunit HisH [Oscillospiraceae bacterium]